MAQVARNLTDIADGFLAAHRFLICDRDGKFTPQFKRIVGDADTQIILFRHSDDQLAVPAHDRVGCHDGRESTQGLSPNPFALGREPPALAVIQPQSSPSELLLQDPVLLDELLDDLVLAAAHPAGD